MNLVVNIAAIVISVFAVVLSAFFGFRQLHSMQKANSTMVAIELLTRECRGNDFLESEEFVLHELSNYSSDDGINGLSPEHRRHATRIGLYFSSLGALSVFGGIETSMIVSLVPTRARRAWNALEPFIMAERKRRSPNYLSFFEHLVCLIADADPAEHHERLGLRRLGSRSAKSGTGLSAVISSSRPALSGSSDGGGPKKSTQAS